jgi:hypothetical protein
MLILKSTLLAQNFLVGKSLYKFYTGYDPDPDPDLANLKNRIRIRTKVVRIRNSGFLQSNFIRAPDSIVVKALRII